MAVSMAGAFEPPRCANSGSGRQNARRRAQHVDVAAARACLDQLPTPTSGRGDDEEKSGQRVVATGQLESCQHDDYGHGDGRADGRALQPVVQHHREALVKNTGLDHSDDSPAGIPSCMPRNSNPNWKTQCEAVAIRSSARTRPLDDRMAGTARKEPQPRPGERRDVAQPQRRGTKAKHQMVTTARTKRSRA